MKTRFCYLHVPKTAGMTLIGMMRQTLGEENVFHATQSRHLQGPLEVLSRRYTVLAGHFTMAQVTAELLDSLFLFSFLRDPVDRVLSLYGFYRHHLVNELDPEVNRAKRLDLKTLLREQDPDRLSVWTNWQTFIFSGLDDCESSAPIALPLAQQNLCKFDYLGFYEQLELSLHQLWNRCGWVFPETAVPVFNSTQVRPRRVELDAETLTLIRRGNSLDQELYACARSLADVGVRPTSAVSAVAAVPTPPSRQARTEHGTREIRVTEVTALSVEDPAVRGTVRHGNTAWVEVNCESDVDCAELTVGLSITDEVGVEVYGTNTFLQDQKILARAGRGFKVAFGFKMILAPGVYSLTVAIHTGNVHYQKCFHWINNVCKLVCIAASKHRFVGSVDLQASVLVTGCDNHLGST